jgi:tRNA U34 5-methylaminomethyl-2-thiouridine-forming methyltransferase MnmC
VESKRKTQEQNNNFVLTNDGSYTLYSKRFDQNYHSLKDGALNESLSKYIIPTFEYFNDAKNLNILDICFGLGYNTLATLYYVKQNNLNITLNIFSPEFDRSLLHSLEQFRYPKEFNCLKDIITTLSKNLHYKDKNVTITIYNGDARKYLNLLDASSIDVVYQDAFSSNVNKLLWTKEYFSQIKRVLKEDGMVLTYSIATPIRLSMFENDINIYQYKPQNSNKITVGLTKQLKKNTIKLDFIDMVLKQKRNKNAFALTDKN